jgi:D-arabinose 1-dehydrogenase-like Zn-dependent alcohol dehydrogenase
MKAAVVHDFTQPLSIENVPRPEAGDGQVLVRIEACGLCHTDIHAAHGDWPIKPPLPLIPGHEGVGIVEALGPGGRGWSVPGHSASDAGICGGHHLGSATMPYLTRPRTGRPRS